MALDSAAKRQAVPGVGRPWMRSQMRDASKGEEWRASAGNAYPVASFAAPPVITVTSFHDCKRTFYEGLGYSGSNNDMELAWLVTNVVSPEGNTRRDLWYQYLIEQAIPPGQLNGMMYDWLGGLGHTGSLNDRWVQYWGC